MKPVLIADKLEGGYRDQAVIRDVSFRVDEGEQLLLVGPNGCGKTTLLKLLVGTLAASGGRVSFLGDDVSRMPPHLRIPMGLGYLMQTKNVFPSLSVDENLHLSFWLGKGDYNTRREQLLEVFPILRDRLAQRAGLISGGERQALAVGMVMMRPVKLLLLDEPTSGLAPKAAEEILLAIHQAKEAFGFASIMVEHNVRLVSRWVSRMLVMRRGRIEAEERNPERLLDHDWLQRYYFT